jgi:hypothetical protein
VLRERASRERRSRERLPRRRSCVTYWLWSVGCLLEVWVQNGIGRFVCGFWYYLLLLLYVSRIGMLDCCYSAVGMSTKWTWKLWRCAKFVFLLLAIE